MDSRRREAKLGNFFNFMYNNPSPKLEELKNTKDLGKMMQILSFLNESFCNIEYLYYEEEEDSEENKENQDQENGDEEDDEMYYSMKKKSKKTTIDLESQGNLCIKKINCLLYYFSIFFIIVFK